ncbi:hypothetical protein SANTM175S_07752 [Streptomyces antimycoticus]
MTAAQRVIEAFNTLNPDTSIFAPESVTWHSFDESEVPTIPDTFAALRAFRSVSPDFRFNDARCEEQTVTCPGLGMYCPGLCPTAPPSGLRPRLR